MNNSKLTLQEALKNLKRRAHVHTDICYGSYRPCGEHHAHDMQCGGKPLWCREREEPELIILLEEYQRLLDLAQMPCLGCGILMITPAYYSKKCLSCEIQESKNV
jgi:hypothetical protein